MSNGLASEKVIVSAPMSFQGSAARIWKVTKADNPFVKWLLLTPLVFVLIGAAWAVVSCWYIFWSLVGAISAYSEEFTQK